MRKIILLNDTGPEKRGSNWGCRKWHKENDGNNTLLLTQSGEYDGHDMLHSCKMENVYKILAGKWTTGCEKLYQI